MSEEEIMNTINNMIAGCKYEQFKAIQGLLDLFYKEKEKNIMAYSKGYADGSWNEGENWENKIREVLRKYEYDENYTKELFYKDLKKLLKEGNN